MTILDAESDKRGILLQEIGDALEYGIEVNTLTLQLKIGEAELRDGKAATEAVSGMGPGRDDVRGRARGPR